MNLFHKAAVTVHEHRSLQHHAVQQHPAASLLSSCSEPSSRPGQHLCQRRQPACKDPRRPTDFSNARTHTIGKHKTAYFKLICMHVCMHARNCAFDKPRNQLLNESMAEYVVFFDDDVVPSPCGISAYVEAFAAYPEVGLPERAAQASLETSNDAVSTVPVLRTRSKIIPPPRFLQRLTGARKVPTVGWKCSFWEKA
eukprot:365906-Chlamydomonas_euryale.AAC.21